MRIWISGLCLALILIFSLVSSAEALTRDEIKKIQDKKKTAKKVTIKDPRFKNLNKKPMTAQEAIAQHKEREKILQQIRDQKNQSKGVILNITTIRLDGTCIQAVKANIKSNCPGYEKLSRFDLTNQDKAGKFIEQDGWFHRVKTNNFKWTEELDNKTRIVCVDCILDKQLQVSHSITIVNRLIYTMGGQQYVNGSVTYFKDLYIDSDCKDAVLVYSPERLLNTIYHLDSGCKIAKMDNTIKIEGVKTKIKSNDPGYAYQKYLEEAKKLKTINCIKSLAC